MQAVLEYAKQHKIFVGIAVVVVLVIIYFLWLKRSKNTTTKTDKFTTKSSTDGKKKIPKIGGGSLSKTSKNKKKHKNKQENTNGSNDDPAYGSDEEDTQNSEVLTLAKNLHEILHDDLSNESLTLDEFKNLSEGKVNSAVYTELVQLYDSSPDPSRVSHKEYVSIIKNHVEK